jgi:hypothetical protein
VFFKPTQDEDAGVMLRPEHHHGHTPDIEKVELWPDHRSVAGSAFESGEEVYLDTKEKVEARLQKVPHGRDMGSLLCIPAYGPHDDRPIGVFSVDSNREQAFTTSDREFAGVCASMLALVDFLSSVFEEEAQQVTPNEPPELPAGG